MTLTSAKDASLRLHAGGEVAFLDVREAGQFGEGHPLFAIPAPYSQLELRIGALVPRPDVPVMLLDADDGVAGRAATRLAQYGYTDVCVIEGGIAGWEAADLPVYKGVNVPSKVLGEMAEQIWHPATISADQLAKWQRDRHAFRFFDARPPLEYAKMRVPGAVCLPNGELAQQLASSQDAAPEAVVITCAGRTRGIVGAIGVKLAGYGGAVYALENGTQGWALAGGTLERENCVEDYPALDAAAHTASSSAADRLMARFGIPQLEAAAARQMLTDPARSTYLFDTRSAPEALADPVPGAISAPGGQLVQATDQWIGVRHARLILCCDSGLRSALAAFWLRQLGYDPYVVRIDAALRQGVAHAGPSFPIPQLNAMPAGAALSLLHAGEALLLDLRGSLAYRKKHVAGASWTMRPILRPLMARARAARYVLLVADDPAMAALVALDLRAGGVCAVSRIEGGDAALVQAGAACETTAGLPPDAQAIDHLFFVHDRHDGNLDAARRYLAWETGLIAQLSDAERAEFSMFRP